MAAWYAGPLVRYRNGFLLSLQHLRTDQTVVLQLESDLRVGSAKAIDSPLTIVDASFDGHWVYAVHHLGAPEIVAYRVSSRP